jgi:uncharacterized protein (TIGR02246 family)
MRVGRNLRTASTLAASALALVWLGACAAPEQPAEPAAPPPPAVDVAAEAEAIRARSAEWMALAQAKDASGIATGIFAEDGVSLFDGDVWLGRSAIEAGQAADYAENPNSTIQWTTSKVEVAASGDLAYERGSTISDPDGPGDAPERRGEYLTVWKKIDGVWRAVADAGTGMTTPTPAPAPESGA